eukprot:1192919-Prorocentrum_minimum.AAC.4
MTRDRLFGARASEVLLGQVAGDEVSELGVPQRPAAVHEPHLLLRCLRHERIGGSLQRGDQSREERENMPAGGTSHARGERIYLQGGPVTRGEREYTCRAAECSVQCSISPLSTRSNRSRPVGARPAFLRESATPHPATSHYVNVTIPPPPVTST